MKNGRRPRQQYRAGAAERLRMVEQFRRSGLTRAAFSQQYGIPLATLNWWLTRTKAASTSGVRTAGTRRTEREQANSSRGRSELAVPVAFSEIRLTPPTPIPTHGWAMEVVGRSGLTIRFREALPVRELVRLLRAAAC